MQQNVNPTKHMKTAEVKSLFCALKFQVPSTPEEYQKVTGTDVVDDAVNYALYRGPLSKWREEFVSFLEQATGVERAKTVLSTNPDGTPKEVKWETAETYVRRLLSSLGVTPEVFSQQYAQKAQEIASGISFASEPRTVKPKTPPKTYLTYAQQIVDAGKATSAAATLASELGVEVGEDVTSIAFALQEREARRRATLFADLK